MGRKQTGAGEFGFLEALMKRGFVTIPRLVFDYMTDLQLDYHTIGRLFALLACVGGDSESAFGSYTVTRRSNPRDFEQVRALAQALELEDMVRCEAVSEAEITFSLTPFYFRLRAVWEQYRERHEEEKAATGPHPAVALTERLLGRPLSDREMRDVLAWVDELNFDLAMVEAVIQEGRRQGVTRMSYLRAIAQGWAEAGVRTPEQVAAYLQEHQKLSVQFRAATTALGIKRPLTKAEEGILGRWYHEWALHDSVIAEACRQSSGAGNPLQYANKVLESWHREGIRSVADLERLHEQRKRATAASADTARTTPARGRKAAPAKSNVILRRDKDEGYYDSVFKKYRD